MKATFRVDERKFQGTLHEYIGYTKRDIKTVIATKGFYIARRAVRVTKKASAANIRAFMNSPAGARMINKSLGKGQGLYGDDMKAAVKQVLAKRLHGIGFLASGWIPAIKQFSPYAEHAGGLGGSGLESKFKQPKGGAQLQFGSFLARAILFNTSQSRWDKGGFLGEGEKGLQKAFDFETKSMRDYINKKLEESARRATIKVLA